MIRSTDDQGVNQSVLPSSSCAAEMVDNPGLIINHGSGNEPTLLPPPPQKKKGLKRVGEIESVGNHEKT